MKPRARRKRYPHVAVYVDTSRNYGRNILHGIADYVETYGPWSIFVDPDATGDIDLSWLTRWTGDGILAFIVNRRAASRLRRSKTPTVELYGYRNDLQLPCVANDEIAIGRLAATHLIDRQFANFAYSGYADQRWAERRYRGFADAIAEAGFHCHRFRYARHRPTIASWEKTQDRLIAWLHPLPKPLGLMACSDRHAQSILAACRRAQLAVPEEVAVIGVDNDEEMCRLSDPPLSSIIENSRKVGFEAARLLDRLMTGQVQPHHVQPVLIDPPGVVTRRSTDVTAIDDEVIAHAVQFIRERACDSIGVDHVLDALSVSRSAFYRRFQAIVGRSPHEEIVRVQLERVKNLLTLTSLPLPRIAQLAGFKHPEYMSVAFKREVGITPGQFRKRHRQPA